ncbi:MAG: hypothetical protein QXM52_04035 [Candidatus Bathyarchaeia archaeon]
MQKIVSGMMLALFLASMLLLAFDFQPVGASGTIYIKADGSIDPPTAPIKRDGTFTHLQVTFMAPLSLRRITSQIRQVTLSRN